MAGSRKLRKFDIGLTSVLLLPVVLCIVSVIFSLCLGSSVMFYAGIPFLLLAAASVGSFVGVSGFVARQMEKRLQRRKYTDAAAIFYASLKVLLFTCLGGFLLCWGGTFLLHNALSAATFRMYLPALFLYPFPGLFQGLLIGTGTQRSKRIAALMPWAMAIGTFTAGGILSVTGYTRGVKVGALLRNDSMGYVYAACGMATGVCIVVCAVLLLGAVAGFLSLRSLQRSHRFRQDDLFGSDGKEDPAAMFAYCLRHLVLALTMPMFPVMAIVIGSRLWMSSQEIRSNTLASYWGGFVGIGLPVCTGLAFLAAMPFTALATQVVRAWQAGKKKAMRMRLSLLLRLSAYVGIPMSAFVFAAAKEIAAMFHALTFKAEESAILSLKSGSFLIFLFQTIILVLIVYWNCNGKRMIFLAGCVSFFAGIVLQVLLHLFGVGITMNMWALDIIAAVFLIALYLGGHSLLGRLDASFWYDDFLIAACAGVSAIPLILLNDYLILVMPAALAFLLMLAVYWVLFVVLSILLRAADLLNMHRIPLGEWIYDIAVILGAAAPKEDEEDA